MVANSQNGVYPTLLPNIRKSQLLAGIEQRCPLWPKIEKMKFQGIASQYSDRNCVETALIPSNDPTQNFKYSREIMKFRFFSMGIKNFLTRNRRSHLIYDGLSNFLRETEHFNPEHCKNKEGKCFTAI